MKTHFLKSKYRILVLVDLSRESLDAFNYTVNLSKLINGSIEIFYVKPPTDIVKNENQTSAIAAIDEERSSIKRQLKELVDTTSELENLPIIYNFTFGNVKNEVKEHIEKTSPDIVVLGRSKPKLLDFFSDGLTQSIVNTFDGSVLIMGDTNNIAPYTDMLLGFFNENSNQGNYKVTQDLKRLNNSPSIHFRLRNKAPGTSERLDSSSTITFEFEEGSNALHGLPSYIVKSNIELLCLGRDLKNEKTPSLFNSITTNIKQLLNKTNVPILILGQQSVIKIQ
ncbi:MAG: universal stress protein [Cellulophaga sp.]